MTILDDPADRGVISVTAVTDTVSEGSEVTFRVDLSGGVTEEEVIVVEWRVSCSADSDVTAEDFVGGCPLGTVTIASGETLTTFAVSTNDDNVVEGMEEFVVTLSSVSPTIDGRITISDTISTASVTITDSDTGTIVISPRGFRALSAGFEHTCGIIEGGIDDGEATCWGSDQLRQSTPPSGVRFRALSAGSRHTCGIREGGISMMVKWLAGVWVMVYLLLPWVSVSAHWAQGTFMRHKEGGIPMVKRHAGEVISIYSSVGCPFPRIERRRISHVRHNRGR